MKWLSDYINIDMPLKAFADGMTMSGSKVEKYAALSEPLEKVVVGKVIALERHTNSDKLWIVHVDIGLDAPIQIVTGAQNVYDGAYVPVVLDGGTVINRTEGGVMKIKKGKLRGVVSNGMLCSFDELGLTQEDFPYASADGILILNEDPEFEHIQVGMDICTFIGLDDTVVEFEITNNRPDCLSVLGLAREAAATFNVPFQPPNPTFQGQALPLDLTVDVRNNKLCTRYMAAVVKNVKIAPSPRWMVERLRASGVRAINNLVDITNFVMLEYGHPMHAFDKRYVSGNQIIVRNAMQDEEIVLLDGNKKVLSPEMLVIADTKKPIAVAGVMGGEHSGIMADTTEVVFEAACFDGVSVRRTAKKLGVRTESSSRFEKGIDPINAQNALFRALELIEQLQCGEVVRDVIDMDYSNKELPRIYHNPAKINALLGSDIHQTEQVSILKRLGFSYDDGFVSPPHVRTDIERECDLAEEIARIYGYNNIRSSIPKLATQGAVTVQESFERRIAQILTAQGCDECLTFGFISPRAYAKANVDESQRNSVVIRNPLGEDTSVMRRSMLPSMLDVLTRNYNNRMQAGRFYETGRIYIPSAEQHLPNEELIICIGTYGPDEDFFSLKGIVEELLDKCNLDMTEVHFTALRSNKSYHTGRCAEITCNGAVIGTLGEIHPIVTERYNIDTRAYAAEIYFARILQFAKAVPKFKSLPKYPAIQRDLSLVCDIEMPAGDIEQLIRDASTTLEDVRLFDMYQGEQVPEDKKSLSYKLVFRKRDATLTDEEADRFVQKILTKLGEKSIVLRK